VHELTACSTLTFAVLQVTVVQLLSALAVCGVQLGTATLGRFTGTQEMVM
jgi:hypothetical protein